MSRRYGGHFEVNATQLWLPRKVVKASVDGADVPSHLVAAPSVAGVATDAEHVCLGRLGQAKARHHSGSASSSASKPSSE